MGNNNYASNYSGSKGKANVKPQGQTSGHFGNNPSVQSDTRSDGTPLKP